jgi:hypothetical protein
MYIFIQKNYVKGIGSPDEYFFEGLKIKLVLSVHVQMVFKFFSLPYSKEQYT